MARAGESGFIVSPFKRRPDPYAEAVKRRFKRKREQRQQKAQAPVEPVYQNEESDITKRRKMYD